MKPIRKTLAGWLHRWDWMLLLLATPFLVFPTANRSPILLVIPGLWILGVMLGENLIVRSPLNAGLLLMSVMLLVSVWITPNLETSLPKIAGLVLGLGVYFMFLHQAGRRGGWWLGLFIFLLLGSAVAPLAVLGTNWVTDKFQLISSIIKWFPTGLITLPGAPEGFHPNEVAGALLWVLPGLLFFTLTSLIHPGFTSQGFRTRVTLFLRVKRVLRSGLVLLSLIVGGLLVLTQSRGSYLALAMTLLLAIPIILPARLRLLFIVVIVLVGVGLGYGFASGRIGNLSSGGPADRGFSLVDLQIRLPIWSRAMIAVQDFPVTGMGMNIFRYAIDVFYPLSTARTDSDIGHAHNEFLQAALDLGLPGMIAFISLYLVSFWILISLWMRVRTNPSLSVVPVFPGGIPPSPLLEKTVILCLAGGLLAHLIYGMTDAVALGAKPGVLFWMLLALINGLWVQGQGGMVGNQSVHDIKVII